MPNLVPSDLHTLRPVGTDPRLPKRSSFPKDMEEEWRERQKQRKRKQKKIEYSPDWVAKMKDRIQKSFHSSENRKKLADEGNALSDGSYPIADKQDLKNAAILARSGHGDVGAAKSLISRRAKQMGVKNPLEEKEAVSKSVNGLLSFSSCFSDLTE